MRRRAPTISAALTLLAAAGLYTWYWFHFAGLARQAVVDWMEQRRQEGYAVGIEGLAVGGFPLAFRVRLDGAELAQRGSTPTWTARLPELVAETRPWSPRDWTVAGAHGARLQVDPGAARAAVTIEVARLAGSVGPTPSGSDVAGGLTVALAADTVTAQADEKLAIARVTARAALPAKAQVGHLETWSRAVLAFERITLPAGAGPLGSTIDRLGATVAVKGSVPRGRLREAMTQWRDDGGTLEVETFAMLWGPLDLSATGTLALDGSLQPIGSLTATVEGYNEIVDALAASNAIRTGDALLARTVLGALSRPGPDGRPQIRAPLRLQNGEVYLGPARLARLPRFTWE